MLTESREPSTQPKIYHITDLPHFMGVFLCDYLLTFPTIHTVHQEKHLLSRNAGMEMCV